MCLLGLVYHYLPDCPVFLLANREEAYARPTATPAIRNHADHSQWLGGLDLQAGGTWLGVNQHGLVVAVTNRPKTSVPLTVRSRGILCRELLNCASAQAAHQEAEGSLKNHGYAGFNLVLIDRRTGVVIEAGDDVRVLQLQDGISLVANGPLNDPADGRMARVRQALTQLPDRDWKTWLTASQQICGWHETDRHKTEQSPAICLHRELGGTVSSTVIALTAKPELSQYWSVAGPPCRTGYVDYSQSLQHLLTGSMDFPDNTLTR